MDGNISAAILLTFIAGLSTSVGSLMVLFSKRSNTKFLSIAIGFSAGVMIMMSLGDLLPEALKICTAELGNAYGGIMVALLLVVGLLISAMIDKLVPEHLHDQGGQKDKKKIMHRVGVISAIAIVLHNFPEGIATFIAGYSDISRGISIAAAIAMHNIPEGIAVSIPIYFGTGSRMKAFLYATLSGLSEPLGAVVAYIILAPFINELMLGAIFTIVAGMMIYISFHELLPASREYGHHAFSLSGIIAGIVVIALVMAIF